MKPIQWVLIPVLAGLLLLFYRRLRGHAAVRAVTLLSTGTALLFTLFLDSSTWLANRLGIGRGVDLVTYLALLALMVSCVLLYLRLVRMEARFAEYVRRQAVEAAEPPEAGPPADMAPPDPAR
ncbi:MAG: DUF2304 domain-containing protein [Bacteroidia bacterium]|nr:DUF2304 domain-containing protein [Bacteroidia bacterium]